MELQDIIFFVVFLLFTLLPRKHRRTSDEAPQDMEAVRKRIEALKRQRSHTQPVLPKAEIKETLKPKPVFSAYKHLPVNKTIIPQDPIETPLQTSTISPPVSKPQKDVSSPTHGNLTSWMIGQIILDKPAFKKNYGNFMDR